MKYVLVIGDGMADDPIPKLYGKTPLQYAEIPAMDMLASSGKLGNVLTVPVGMQAGSDVAVLSIFGCDPQTYFTGRAPLEAAAVGISLSPGDVAYRCNMISIEDSDIPFDDKKILSHSSGGIEGSESDALISELLDSPIFKEAAEKAGIFVYPGSSFRHIAVQRVSDAAVMSQKQTDEPSPCLVLTPPHDHLGESLGQHLPRGNENAAALEGLIRLSHEFLDNQPINVNRRKAGKFPGNCIWFWAEGTVMELPNFTEKYGKTGSVVSAVPLCQGIGCLLGLDKVIVEGATGELNTNYEGKVDAAVEALESQDFAVVHIEAPDECTHNGDLKGKLQAIEWIDSRVVAPLLQKLRAKGTDFRLLLMSDHRTLISTRGHDAGPVPYVLYDSRFDEDTGLSFCEEDAEYGVFLTEGAKLMSMLFDGGMD